MRTLIAVGIAVLALAGCSGGEGPVAVDPVVTFTGAREQFRADATLDFVVGRDRVVREQPEEVGQQPARPLEDRALERRIEAVAEKSGVHVLDVTAYDFGRSENYPAVRLQSENAASYMKHDLRRFLETALSKSRYWVVELYDEDGRWAWVGGWMVGGSLMDDTRFDLWNCFRLGGHSELVLIPPPPPCPDGDEQRRHDARERLVEAYRGRALAEELWTAAIAEAREQAISPAEALGTIVAGVEMQREEVLALQKELQQRLR